MTGMATPQLANGFARSFVDQVCSAVWLANVGVPLTVTLASIGLAVVLLRTQLQHDRALQESRRRSEVATELGWALREVTEGVDRIDGDAAMTTERNWNGLPRVSRATRRAQIFGIPDDDAALRLAVDLARDMHWRWRYGVGFAERVEAKHDKGLLGSAVVDCLHQPKVLLNMLAEKFIRWDGRRTLPILTADELGPWTPVRLPPTGPTRAAHVEWKEHFEIEYREMVHRLAQLT
jgi:hypothetical protein